MKVELGDTAVDEVSGFKGVAVAEHTYLNGCSRFSLQPEVGKDGKLPDACTFDTPNLKVLKKKKVAVSSRDTGGPERYMPSARPK